MLPGFTATLSGFAVTQAGWVLAQTEPGADFGPWVSAGGSVTAVAGIVYIAKMLADGKLVARDPSQVEQQLKALVEKVSEVAREGHEREQDYMRLLRGKRD